MPPNLLVDVDWLAAHLGAPDLRVADVRWVLGRPGAGRALHEQSRIPGSVFVDIDEDLAEIGDPRRGRHPLPRPEQLVQALAARGIGAGQRIVAYDDAGGAHAARLWFLLRWLGVDSAVLDGGFAAWTGAGQPIEEGAARATAPAAPLPARVDGSLLADRAEVQRIVTARTRPPILLDARAAERFRGDVEPVDPRPGHIPTALSAPGAAMLAHGRFRPPGSLRDDFDALGVARGSDVVCYCGSGVTACHLLLALALAGHTGARLYPGSYSEWSNDPTLEVERG